MKARSLPAISLYLLPTRDERYKDSHGIDNVVQNQLQGLLLTHHNALLLRLLVLQNTHLSSASLLPNILANLVTILIFLIEQEQLAAPIESIKSLGRPTRGTPQSRPPHQT